MFALLAVLLFVVVVVLGVALVEAFDPMPKAQAWGQAAYAQAVAVAPPVVPVVVVRDDGTRFDYTMPEWVVWLDEERAKDARRTLEAFWDEREDELDRREAKRVAHAEWVAYRNWLRREKAAEDALGNEHEQAMWAKYMTSQYNRSCITPSCTLTPAEQAAEAYEIKQAGKTRRAKSAHSKWGSQPDNSKPALVKCNLQHIDRVWDWQNQTWEKTVEISQEVFVYNRSLVPAGRSHNTKHVNPFKGAARMSTRLGQLDMAFGDVWENEFDS